jgi:hypothetical protein
LLRIGKPHKVIPGARSKLTKNAVALKSHNQFMVSSSLQGNSRLKSIEKDFFYLGLPVEKPEFISKSDLDLKKKIDYLTLDGVEELQKYKNTLPASSTIKHYSDLKIQEQYSTKEIIYGRFSIKGILFHVRIEIITFELKKYIQFKAYNHDQSVNTTQYIIDQRAAWKVINALNEDNNINAECTLLKYFVQGLSNFNGTALFLGVSDKLYPERGSINFNKIKYSLCRSGVRDIFFKNYTKIPFRTARVIPPYGNFIIDFNIYVKKLGINDYDFYCHIVATSFCTKSDGYSMFMNKEDILNHIDPYIQDKLFERNQLFLCLQRFGAKIKIKRRGMCKRLEIQHTPYSALPVSYSNEFKFATESSTWIEKRTHEVILVGHFVRRVGREYVLVTVSRHITQPMFTVKLYIKRTFKTFTFKFYFAEISDLINNHTVDILKLKYYYLQFVALNTRNYASFVESVVEIENDELKQLDIKENRRLIGLNELDLENPQHRHLMTYVWERFVQHFNLTYFRTKEIMIKIQSFNSILKQQLVSNFCTLDQRHFFWIDIKIGKNPFEHFWRCYDHLTSQEYLMNLEIYVSIKELNTENSSSEKIIIREFLSPEDPIINKIQNNQFRITDLLEIGHRIYDRVIDCLKKSRKTNLRGMMLGQPQRGLLNDRDTRMIKIREKPMYSNDPHIQYLSIDKLHILTTKRLSSKYPIFMSRHLFMMKPRKLCTVLLLNATEIIFIIQDSENSSMRYKIISEELAKGFIPGYVAMVNESCFETLGERLFATFKNVLLVDDMTYSLHTRLEEEEK